MRWLRDSCNRFPRECEGCGERIEKPTKFQKLCFKCKYKVRHAKRKVNGKV